MKRRDIIAEFGELKNSHENIELYKIHAYTFDKNSGSPYKGCLELTYNFLDQSGRRSFSNVAWFPLISLWVDEYSTSPLVCKAIATVIQSPEMKETKNALFVSKCLSLLGTLEVSKDGQKMSLLSDQNSTIISCFAATEHYLTYREGGTGTGSRVVPIYDNATIAIKETLKVMEEGTGNTISGKDLVDYSSVSEEVLKEVGFVEVKDTVGRGNSMWMGYPKKLILGQKEEYYGSWQRRGHHDFGVRREHGKRISQLVMDKLSLRLS